MPCGGWAGGKKHSTVDYVFTHPPEFLYVYHVQVLGLLPGMKIDVLWLFEAEYRGRRSPPWPQMDEATIARLWDAEELWLPIYPEHNAEYYLECRKNLADKGFDVEQIPETVDGCNPYG